MTIKKHIATGQKAFATGLVAVKTYEKAKRSFEKWAQILCHTWVIDDDHEFELYQVAEAVIKESRASMPGLRQQRLAEDQKYAIPFWSWVPIKGIGPVQVKTHGYGVWMFRAGRVADLDALKAHLEKVAESMEVEERNEIDFDPWATKPTTTIMAWDAKDKQWESRKQRNARTFSSVILPAELQSEIEADLTRFTSQAARMQRLELPWRRGYLFEGPPGTGKTSVSLAIAGALSFNLASLSLTDIKSDGQLREAVARLRPRTVLVIEDIDAYKVSHDRDHDAGQSGDLSLSGILNALDGFETPEGLVTICTSNHKEQLDPALIRPGRLDRTFTLDYIASTELERLFAWFYETEVPSPAPQFGTEVALSPAEATELFKQHFEDGPAGWAAVLERVEQRPALKSVA